MEDKTNDIPSSRTDDENGNSARELNQSDEESSSVNLVEQQEDNTDCEETEGSAGNEGESEQDPDNSPSPDIDANEPLNAQGIEIHIHVPEQAELEEEGMIEPEEVVVFQPEVVTPVVVHQAPEEESNSGKTAGNPPYSGNDSSAPNAGEVPSLRSIAEKAAVTDIDNKKNVINICKTIVSECADNAVESSQRHALSQAINAQIAHRARRRRCVTINIPSDAPAPDQQNLVANRRDNSLDDEWSELFTGDELEGIASDSIIYSIMLILGGVVLSGLLYAFMRR